MSNNCENCENGIRYKDGDGVERVQCRFPNNPLDYRSSSAHDCYKWERKY